MTNDGLPEPAMTKCCGKTGEPYPVMWNPGNAVVQCHICGTVYEPEPTADAPASPFYIVPAGLTREQFAAILDVIYQASSNATAAERERCAKLCDSVAFGWDEQRPFAKVAHDCAAAIRKGESQ